jgi:hypothetical protein
MLKPFSWNAALETAMTRYGQSLPTSLKMAIHLDNIPMVSLLL